MAGLRSVLRRGDPTRVPKRDEHLTVAESLLAEVDFHIQELERVFHHRRQQEQIVRTGVDYSWLVSETPKVYKVPQLERLELEELCLKLEANECSKVVSLFREAVLREPSVQELARIMRTCVIQVLDDRPKIYESNGISDWMVRRASSFVSSKLKPTTRVGPAADENDIEMQSETSNRSTRAFSMPNFTVTAREVPTIRVVEGASGAYPV